MNTEIILLTLSVYTTLIIVSDFSFLCIIVLLLYMYTLNSDCSVLNLE